MKKAPAATKKTPDINLKALVAHALCDVVPGGLTEDEHAALVADLKDNGMHFPIILFQGKVLDGRARYRAAQQADVAIKYEQFDGDEEAARAFVVSANLQRRTLSSMQKALTVAEIYTRAVNTDGPKPSQDTLAKRYGCSKQSISLCVKAIAAKNSMLLTRLRRGEVSRGELEEEFYDREAANTPVATTPPAAAESGGDIFGAAPLPTKGAAAHFPPMPSSSGKPAAGGKVAHPERRTSETPASAAAATVKALSAQDRINFVSLAWPWLEAAVVAHQAMVKAKDGEHPGKKAPSKGAAALMAKGKATSKAG